MEPLGKIIFFLYKVDCILPQISTASASAHASCSLRQMQYRFAVIYGPPCIPILLYCWDYNCLYFYSIVQIIYVVVDVIKQIKDVKSFVYCQTLSKPNRAQSSATCLFIFPVSIICLTGIPSFKLNCSMQDIQSFPWAYEKCLTWQPF